MDTSVILPTESRWSQALAEYASVQNNNSPIGPALNAFARVCSYMRLTDTSMPAYSAGDLP